MKSDCPIKMNIKVLSRQNVEQVLNLSEVISSVKNVYCKKSEGQAVTWPILFYDFEHEKADMDIKSGYIKGVEVYGSKTVSWFGNNTDLNLSTFDCILK